MGHHHQLLCRTGCQLFIEQQVDLHQILGELMEWTCGTLCLGIGTFHQHHSDIEAMDFGNEHMAIFTTICRDSPRNLMLHNIDEQREIAAVSPNKTKEIQSPYSRSQIPRWKKVKALTLQVRVGDWKLVKGTTYEGAWDSWYCQISQSTKHILFMSKDLGLLRVQC